ncbi:pulmonary surfactant-associated protein B isoform X2 [Rhinatrema bivittatum]|uniref:pulmonary surfactant-associated protein B isoform X2 n=1 Tax=Rhinatrema bivittatum TaxID=194408 RepID=UPI00112BECBF|nr:pulmonary surfactant-associated protein B isoform X2 [Rhinatrema bivittatum]
MQFTSQDSKMQAAGLVILSWICVSTAVNGKVLVQNECGQGPEFWCQDFVTAVQCGALEHCIQTVWMQEEGINWCDKCKQTVTFFNKMIEDGTGQDGIKMFLHKICNLNPLIVLPCRTIVDKFVSKIMQFIKNHMKPDVICTTLRLCQSDESENEIQELLTDPVNAWLLLWDEDSFSLPHDHTTAWSNGCDKCKQLVTFLTNMIEESTVQDGIKSFLHKECNLIPLKSVVLHCQSMVDKQVSKIMQFIKSQMKPDVICTTLRLCQSDESENEIQELLTDPVNAWLPLWDEDSFSLPHGHTTAWADELKDFPIPLPTCWLCRSLIGKVEAAIPKDAIAKTLTQLCRVMPSKISGICQCLMEKYTIILLDTVLSKLGPQLLCGFLFLCTTENCRSDTTVIPVPAKDIKCDTCVTITALAKAFISENSSVIETEAVLLNTCTNYQLDWHECQKFIQQHQSELLVVLKKNWDYHTTCQEIGACGAVASTSLGAAGCTRGPAYWCSSMDAAKECNAVLHCQTHIWN